jgi:hypothetical protein
MTENFTITYETDNGLLKGRTIMVTSPQLTKRQASEFIGAIGGKKLRRISVDGKMADSETALELLREAKVFSK